MSIPHLFPWCRGLFATQEADFSPKRARNQAFGAADARAVPSLLPFFRKRWPGQLPTTIAFPEPYDDDVFTPEGDELHIIEQGRTDTADTTSLHVPSIDLVGPHTRELRELDCRAGSFGGVEPEDRRRRPQEARRPRHTVTANSTTR
jgi:hypothetical protein